MIVLLGLLGSMRLPPELGSAMRSYRRGQMLSLIRSSRARQDVRMTFAKLLQFNPGSPSQRYYLDFAMPGDIDLLRRIQIICMWERKLLRHLNAPEFTEGGDDCLMRNIEIDSMNFVFLSSEGCLLHLSSRDKVNLSEVLAGQETGLIKRDARMRVDYYSPFHPLPSDKTRLHERCLERVLEILVTETQLPKNTDDEDEPLRHISKDGKLMALSAISDRFALSLEDFMKVLLVFDRPDTRKREIKAKGGKTSSDEEAEEFVVSGPRGNGQMREIV